MGVYDFTVKTNKGVEKSLADYKGKVLLIVNTASKCGFTPQFEGLQKLYTEYKDKVLEILGFPCNQFAAQDPGNNDEIQSFCKLNYGVTFQIFEKGDVRGESAQPLFKYLTAQKKFEGFNKSNPMSEKLTEVLQNNFPEYLEGDGIKWNFTKFLIDKNGEVIARFEPTTDPADIAADIEKLL
jgi:glutathione peroxidase